MALFNSNLSSSISGWFTSTFQARPESENSTALDKEDNEHIRETAENNVSVFFSNQAGW